MLQTPRNESESLAPRTPLDTGTMVRYGLGQTGAQVFRDTPAALLPVYMTTVLGVPAWLAGLVILLPKLWVIICDPLVGAWSDRRESSIGRIPFLVGGAIATSIGFVLLFNLPAMGSPYAAAATSAVFLLAMTAFSAFSVPYLAVATTLSADPHERTKLLAWRIAFTTLGVVLGIGLAQPTVVWLGGGRQAWSVMSVIFAALCLVSMLGCALGLRSRLHRPAAAKAPVPFTRMLGAAWRNRAFRQLTAIHLLQTVGQACSYTVVALVFVYLVDRIELLTAYVLIMSLAGLVTQPLWLRISRRIGKISLFVYLCLGWCAVTLTWLGIDWGDGVSFGAVSGKDVLILLRGAVIGVTNAGFILLVTSLFTDTVHLGEHESGIEGGYAGLWSACEKLSFALGPVISGAVLSLYGFVSSTAGPAQQSPAALFGVVLNYSLIPVGFFLASLLLVPGLARAIRGDYP